MIRTERLRGFVIGAAGGGVGVEKMVGLGDGLVGGYQGRARRVYRVSVDVKWVWVEGEILRNRAADGWFDGDEVEELCWDDNIVCVM